MSVYSIHKETHSSDDPATHERHYAGWTPNQDDAILRANEIYEGRDSTEAVLVIGNGRTGIEVVYRVGDENQGCHRAIRLHAGVRLEAEDGEPLFELVREHMDREHPEKGIEGEQVRNRIDAKAYDAG